MAKSRNQIHVYTHDSSLSHLSSPKEVTKQFFELKEKSGQTGATKKEFDASKVKVFNPENDSYDTDFEAESYELIKWVVFHVRNVMTPFILV